MKENSAKVHIDKIYCSFCDDLSSLFLPRVKHVPVPGDTTN